MKVAKDPDAYDEETEGFGVKSEPVITDELVAEIKAALDNPSNIPYTNKAPQEQKETPMAEKVKIDNSKIRELDPRILKVQQGFNARDYSTKSNIAHVNDLAASIKEVGVLESLVIRYEPKTGEYFVVGGESRLRATLQAIKDGAPIKTVPVTFEKKGTNTEDRLAEQMLRNEGKQFEILEQAHIFQQLAKFGWKDQEIAKKTGKTGPFVGSVLKLAAAPAKLKKLISDGQVSATLAIDILRGQEFDFEKAYAALSDAIATAAATGKNKATAKHVDPKAKKAKAETGTPLHFQRTIVKTFIDVLAEIAADTSLTRGIRSKCKDVLENADVDAKEWLKENEEGER
jgi:ParB/RepB/Spo0J family partition protein